MGSQKPRIVLRRSAKHAGVCHARDSRLRYVLYRTCASCPPRPAKKETAQKGGLNANTFWFRLSHCLMDDLQRLKARYQATSEAYREIADRNARQALKGGHPTAEALQREETAHEQLAAARRTYLNLLKRDD
jgi:hypothetical protein